MVNSRTTGTRGSCFLGFGAPPIFWGTTGFGPVLQRPISGPLDFEGKHRWPILLKGDKGASFPLNFTSYYYFRYFVVAFSRNVLSFFHLEGFETLIPTERKYLGLGPFLCRRPSQILQGDRPFRKHLVPWYLGAAWRLHFSGESRNASIFWMVKNQSFSEKHMVTCWMLKKQHLGFLNGKLCGKAKAT